MKVRYDGAHYLIPLGTSSTDPKLTLTTTEARTLAENLLRELNRQGDITPALQKTIADIAFA